MEKLAETLAALRVVLTEILENSDTESKPLPQIEAPSCTGPKFEASAGVTGRSDKN
jgi:hypothetical protein